MRIFNLLWLQVVVLLIVTFSLDARSDMGGREGAGDTGHGEQIYTYTRILILNYFSGITDVEWDKLKSEVRVKAGKRPSRPKPNKPMISFEGVNRKYIMELTIGAKWSGDEQGPNNLYMDWSRDKDGKMYIKAYSGFSSAMGTFWTENGGVQSYWRNGEKKHPSEDRYVEESLRRVLKEESHTWGYGDTQGTKFANHIIPKIQKAAKESFPSYAILVEKIPTTLSGSRGYASDRYKLTACRVNMTAVDCPETIGSESGYLSGNITEILDELRRYHFYNSFMSNFKLVEGAGEITIGVGVGTACGVATAKSKYGIGVKAFRPDMFSFLATAAMGGLCYYGSYLGAYHLMAKHSFKAAERYSDALIEPINVSDFLGQEKTYFFHNSIIPIDRLAKVLE